MATFGRHTTGAEVVEQYKDVIHGKIIVITGSSVRGLGAETAISLARAGPAHLVLLARSREKVQPVMDEIAKLDSNVVIDFVPVELDKPDSVMAAAEKINSLVPRIDILINNAGIMAPPYTKTEKGIESQFAVNHIGHFILTNHVLGKIRAAGQGARIVNLTSKGYKLAPFFFDDWNFSDGKTYNKWSGYGQSKTANVLFTRYLAKQLAKDGILSYAVHPGAVSETALSDNLDPKDFEILDEVSLKNTGFAFELTESEFRTVQEGVATTIVAAADPRIAGNSGSYLADCAVETLRDYASSDDNARTLWTLSEEIVGQQYQI